MNNQEPICLNSRGGRGGVPDIQPSIKDRVYSVDGVACCIATSEFFNPCYLVEVKEYANKSDSTT